MSPLLGAVSGGHAIKIVKYYILMETNYLRGILLGIRLGSFVVQISLTYLSCFEWPSYGCYITNMYYSLFHCMYLETYNLTCECAIILKFGLLIPLTLYYSIVKYEGVRTNT